MRTPADGNPPDPCRGQAGCWRDVLRSVPHSAILPWSWWVTRPTPLPWARLPIGVRCSSSAVHGMAPPARRTVVLQHRARGDGIGGNFGGRARRHGLAAAQRGPGYALLLTVSVSRWRYRLPRVAFVNVSSVLVSKVCLAGTAMLLLFLPTGPINTLIVESVPVNLRASAMAASIFRHPPFRRPVEPRGIIGTSVPTGGVSPEHPAAGLATRGAYPAGHACGRSGDFLGLAGPF